VAAIVAQTQISKVPPVKSLGTNPEQFSESRASQYNSALFALGPRVICTKEEYATRDYILSQITNITSLSPPYVNIEIETQDFLFNYTMLRNYMVRLSHNQSNVEKDLSILVSSHFDTTEFSRGASDDGTGTSVMLELLYNFVHIFRKTPPTKPLIFLFNDGEESGLLGAAEFLNHKWAANVRRFVNLDSTGTHGKSIMFRLSPSSLISEYKVPHPHTTVIGEEIMTIIPSDTDYTKYRANKTMFGFDLAFYLDGYGYHTALDELKLIDPGALQHAGENVHSIVSNLLRPEVSFTHVLDSTPYIYYDAFSTILVSYSQLTSDLVQIFYLLFIIVSCFIILVIDHIIYIFWDKARKEEDMERISLYHYFQKNIWVAFGMRILLIVVYFVSFILSFVFGIGVTLLVGAIMTGAQPMFWYANGLTSLPLYGCVCLTTMLIIQFVTYLIINALFNTKCIMQWRRTEIEELEDDGETIHQFFAYGIEDERYMALFLFWGLAMLISIASRIRSTYMVLICSTFVVGVLLVTLFIERIVTWAYLIKRIKQDGYAATTPRGTALEVTPATPADIYSPSSKPKISKRKRVLTAIIRNQVHWSFMPYIALFFPTVICIDHLIRLVRMMAPILGRLNKPGIPGTLPPDILVSLVIAIFVAIPSVSLLPSTHRATNYLKIISLFFLASVLSFIVACVAFPYSDITPKRIVVTHTVKSTYQVSNLTSMNTTAPYGSVLVQAVDYRPVLSVLAMYENNMGTSLRYQCTNMFNCTFERQSPYNMTFANVTIMSYDKTANNHNITLSIDHRSNYRISVGVTHNTSAIVTKFDLNDDDLNLYNFTRNNFDNSTRTVIHKYGIESNQTILDLGVTGTSSDSLYVQITLYSCGEIAQSWIRQLYKTVNWVTAMGAKSCQHLQETALIQVVLE
jgi:hypothetical protein